MDQTPTSNADEEEGQDTAPSETSAEKDQPETETAPEEGGPVYLLEELSELDDADVVKIGLTALIVLHRRATGVDNE